MPEENKQKTNRSKVIIGILVCLFILVYLIYQLLTYFTGSSISLYQVAEGSSESAYSSQYTALILRQETVLYSDTGGYVKRTQACVLPAYSVPQSSGSAMDRR